MAYCSVAPPLILRTSGHSINIHISEIKNSLNFWNPNSCKSSAIATFGSPKVHKGLHRWVHDPVGRSSSLCESSGNPTPCLKEVTEWEATKALDLSRIIPTFVNLNQCRGRCYEQVNKDRETENVIESVAESGATAWKACSVSVELVSVCSSDHFHSSDYASVLRKILGWKPRKNKQVSPTHDLNYPFVVSVLLQWVTQYCDGASSWREK